MRIVRSSWITTLFYMPWSEQHKIKPNKHAYVDPSLNPDMQNSNRASFFAKGLQLSTTSRYDVPYWWVAKEIHFISHKFSELLGSSFCFLVHPLHSKNSPKNLFQFRQIFWMVVVAWRLWLFAFGGCI